jgi:hypothetical protein
MPPVAVPLGSGLGGGGACAKAAAAPIMSETTRISDPTLSRLDIVFLPVWGRSSLPAR